MRALRAPQVDGDLQLQRCVDVLAEKMPQHDVLRRNGAVGFQLEDPMTVRLLAREQGVGGPADRLVERRFGHVGAGSCGRVTHRGVFLVRRHLADKFGGAMA